MRKGRRAEELAIDLYESAGFEVYQPPQAKYREQDIFGLFDLAAFGHGRLELIQIKAGRDAAGIHDWFETASLYEEHLEDVRLAFLHRCEGSWRVARSTPDGYEWVYDGREAFETDEALLAVLS